MPGLEEIVLAAAAIKGIRPVKNTAGIEWRALRMADSLELIGHALEKTLKVIAQEVAKREKAATKAAKGGNRLDQTQEAMACFAQQQGLAADGGIGTIGDVTECLVVNYAIWVCPWTIFLTGV